MCPGWLGAWGWGRALPASAYTAEGPSYVMGLHRLRHACQLRAACMRGAHTLACPTEPTCATSATSMCWKLWLACGS